MSCSDVRNLLWVSPSSPDYPLHRLLFFLISAFLFHINLFLTLFLPGTRWTGQNTDLSLNSGISKIVKVYGNLSNTPFKEYWMSFLMIPRLIDFALVVLYLLRFKVYGNFGIWKIEFFNFSRTEAVKDNFWHGSREEVDFL